MVRLERFLTGLLASQPDPEQRKVLHRYTIWHLIRRLRRRNNGRPLTPQQFNSARQRTHAAIAFLNWLTAHDLTLASAGKPASTAGSPTTWPPTATRPGTSSAGPAPTSSPPSTSPPSAGTAPPSHSTTNTAGTSHARLLHDDTLKPEDRLAGLLLLLYAQGPSAIHRLTTEDIEVGAQAVRLHLGDAPVQLPEPVAALARAVAANRKGHATIGALTPSPWLFPGGQPGRPISTTQLTQRLTNLGIRPNQARSTVLFQLATEIPAAILARTLGIHTDVAVAWQRLSAGDWTNYAAAISQRAVRSHQQGRDVRDR